MIIGLLGDLEGDRDWAVAQLEGIGARGDVDTVCQLGDLRFGMGDDPYGYLAAIDLACGGAGIRLLCVPGNHENWARLDAPWSSARWQDEDGRLNPIRIADHVEVLPRGHRWEMGGRTSVALGGAPSVNRHLLTEGVSWWPTEVISGDHVDTTVLDGHANIMLTHDSPAPPYCMPPVERTMRENPWDWPDPSLAYAQVGIDRLTRAVMGVKPRLLAHGHFHVAGEASVRLPGAEYDTTIWSLGANQDPHSLRFLDLDLLADPAS